MLSKDRAGKNERKEKIESEIINDVSLRFVFYMDRTDYSQISEATTAFRQNKMFGGCFRQNSHVFG